MPHLHRQVERGSGALYGIQVAAEVGSGRPEHLDSAVFDANICRVWGADRAIDNASVSNQQIVHRVCLLTAQAALALTLSSKTPIGIWLVEEPRRLVAFPHTIDRAVPLYPA
jgi:hypothetical protein